MERAMRGHIGLTVAAAYAVIVGMRVTATAGDWVPAAEPAPLRAAVADLARSFIEAGKAQFAKQPR